MGTARGAGSQHVSFVLLFFAAILLQQSTHILVDAQSANLGNYSCTACSATKGSGSSLDPFVLNQACARPDGYCQYDLFKFNNGTPSGSPPDCTANDVRLATLTSTTSKFCIAGEVTTFTLVGQVLVGAQDRYDIAFNLNRNGGSAKTGTTCLDVQLPRTCPTCAVDYFKQEKPNGNEAEDCCGDWTQNDGGNGGGPPLFITLPSFTALCQAPNNTGSKVGFSYCASWSVGKTSNICYGFGVGNLSAPGPGQAYDSKSFELAAADTNSKCRCETVFSDIQVVSLDISKTATPSIVTTAGQVITYSVQLTNSGGVTLTGVYAKDNNLTSLDSTDDFNLTAPGWIPAGSTLAPGSIQFFSYNYTVTQADIDTKSNLVNIVTATSVETKKFVNDTETVAVQGTTSMSLEKTASPQTVVNAGQNVTYTYKVTNTGTRTLSNITVVDDNFTNGANYSITLIGRQSNATDLTLKNDLLLSPFEAWTYTYVYTVTQADIDSGLSKTNKAKATSNLSPPAYDTETITISQSPSVSLTKVANVSTVTSPTTILYTFTVNNTGTVTLSSVSLKDFGWTNATLDDKFPTLVVTSGTADGQLSPRETWQYTLEATVTQATIDSFFLGSLVNNATVTTNKANDTASATVSVTAVPGLSFSKTADKTPVSAAGEKITYTYTLSNTGDLTLTNVQLKDDYATPSNPSDDKNLTVFTSSQNSTDPNLNVGEVWTFTFVYNVTQADIDTNRTITNTAYVTTDQTPTKNTSATVYTDGKAHIGIHKDASPSLVMTAGTEITYTVQVKNNGNRTLTSVTVMDLGYTNGTIDNFALDLKKDADSDAVDPGVLNVGETWVYTYTVLVTQDQIDAGDQLINTVSATSAQDGPVYATATVNVTQVPNMAVTKLADVEQVARANAGIVYTYTVKNIGTVSLTNIQIVDDSFTALNKTDDLSPVFVNSSFPGALGADGKLQPNEIWTYTLSVNVTQAEMDSGADLKNVVYAVSTQTGGVNGTKFVADETVDVIQVKSWALDKTTTTKEVTDAGTVITYKYVLANNGTVTIENVLLTDSGWRSGPSDNVNLTEFTSNFNPDPFPTKLEVGEVWTYYQNFTVSQAIIDDKLGSLTNNVTATSTTIPVPEIDSATVPVLYLPEMRVSKLPNCSTVEKVGDQVTYTYTVENIGKVTLTDIVVTDDMFTNDTTTDDKNATYTSGDSTTSGTLGKLDVGETWEYTLVYTVKQKDIDDRVPLVNTVFADSSETSPVNATASVGIDYQPRFTVKKNASRSSVTKAEDTVTYTITVENTGFVTLTGATVSDNNLTSSGGDDIDLLSAAKYFVSSSIPSTTSNPLDALDALSPTEKWTFTWTYTVTQADLDSGGQLTNTVTVDTSQTDPSKTASAIVEVTQEPAISLTKSVSKTMVSSAPQVLTYTLNVTNTGTVTLEGVSIVDNMGTSNTTDDKTFNVTGTLDVNQWKTFEYNITVTQADFDLLSEINNTAIASATNFPVSSESSATVNFNKDVSLSFNKEANPTVAGKAGVAITYTYTLTNTGTVTITGIALTDDNATPLNGTDDPAFTTFTTASKNNDTKLDVNETWTYTYVYTTTQDDIDNNRTITNTAVVTSANAPSQNDTATVSTNGAADFSVDKMSSTGQISSPGVVTYTVVVENTGNKTLTNVVIKDTMGTADIGDDQNFTVGTLAVGANKTWVYTLNVTQAMIDAGTNITNVATVSTTQVPDKSDDTLLVVKQEPGLTTNKRSDPTTVTAAGEPIKFYVDVTNTGLVSLSVTQVKDNVLTPSTADDVDLLPTGNGTTALLPPGVTWTYTWNYNVTQADIDGNVPLKNVAFVKVNSLPQQEPDVNVTVAGTRQMTIEKKASTSNITAGGTVVVYTVVVKNTGTVTLPSVSVKDNNFTSAVLTDDVTLTSATGVTWISSTDKSDLNLSPGEVWTFTYNFTVTDALLFASTIPSTMTNVATANSTKFGPVTSSSTITLSPPPDQCRNLPVTKAIDCMSSSTVKGCTKCLGWSDCCAVGTYQGQNLTGQCATSRAYNCPDGNKFICNGGGNKGQGNCGSTVFCNYVKDCRAKTNAQKFDTTNRCWGVTYCKFANNGTISPDACPKDVPSGALCWEDGGSGPNKPGDNFKVCCSAVPANLVPALPNTTGRRRLFGLV